MSTTVQVRPRRAPGSGVDDSRAGEARPAAWVLRQGRWGYGLVAASTIGLALFQLGPLVVALLESGEKFNPITHQVLGYAGTSNFSEVLSDPQFWTSLWNTLIYVGVSAVVELALGLGLALLLDRVIPVVTAVARTAVVAALVLSDAVTALLWSTLLDKTTGPINGVLNLLGIHSVGWLVASPAALISVIIVSVWHGVGLIVLVYLAGLQSLDDDLFKAADVDGANGWQKFRHVTVPGLRRTTVVAIFFATIQGLQIFVPINLMTSGGPNESSSNLLYYVYQQGVNNLDYGVAAAATVFLMILILVVGLVQFLLLRRTAR